MYKPGYVIIGIIVFLVLATSPLWWNLVFGEEKVGPPELEYPKDHTECILPTEYMNEYHMNVLDEWRDKVVREDIRMAEYRGEMMEMSLSRTCMDCHTSKANFCDRCHDYLDVNPYCWDCHVPPEDVTINEAKGGSQ